MTAPIKPDDEFERRLSVCLMDVYIRAGLVLALVVLCWSIFAPFVSLMAWALILAVTLFPAQVALARLFGGRQVPAATLLVLCGIVLIVAPTTVLMAAVGDSVHGLIDGIRHQTLQVPPPPTSIGDWPLVGAKVQAFWMKAHTDLPSVISGMQPKIGELSRTALAMVASTGGSVLMFLFSFLIAGVVMVYGVAGARSAEAIFSRIAGPERGVRFCRLATATIRAVALGVLGVALIQTIVIGLVLLVAKVPLAGFLAVIVLILAIAQVPVLLVTLPVVIYIWASGDYGTAAAISYTVVLVLGGMLDNVLKPLMLARGVEAPMPVILIGALGGMAAKGILGMFVGATVLALGYQIFMGWVAPRPDASQPAAAD